MTVKVSTSQAEKAIKQVEQATKKAADIDTSKATKGIKDQTAALGGWTDRLKAMSEQSEKAGSSIGGLFQRLDAGRLIVAGAAAGMVAYAKSALEMAESSRLNIDLLKEQLGAQSGAAMSFIGAGDTGRGTSSLTRANLMAYMSMTGYKDEGRNEKMITGLEKIMASKEGAYLKNFGINNEKDLLSQLASGNINETSDLGRFVKERSAQFFSPNAMGIEKTKVAADFAKQGKINVSQEVIDAEARRRLAAKAVEDISGGVTEDKDSYRVAMRDLLKSFQTLNAGVGDAVRPAAAVILQFLTTLTRLLAEHPKIATMGATFVVLGAALATAGVAGGLLVSAVTPLLTLTKSQTVATLAHASAETIRATATKAATIAQGALNLVMSANPLGIVIIAIAALVAGLYLLEKKFGLVTKAVQAFKNSEIGKDLLAGAKEGAEWLEAKLKGIWDTVQGIYKMFKGGDLGGALKGGLGLALKISPIGMIAGFAEALNPSKRVQEESLYVLKKLKETWDGFIKWLSDIWESIKALLDPITGMWKWITTDLPVLIANLPELIKQKIKDWWEGKDSEETNAKQYTIDDIKEAEDPRFKGKFRYWDPAVGKYGYTDTKEEALAKMNALSGGKPSSLGDEQEAANPGSTVLVEDVAGNPYRQPVAPAAPTTPDSFSAPAHPETFEEKAAREKAARVAAETPATMEASAVALLGASIQKKYATGGEVTKSGIAWVDEGEPIVPAEVARSGPVIDALKGLASGGGRAEAGGGGGVHIGSITINSNSGDGRTLAQQFREELDRQLSDFEFKHRQEGTFRRANRAYQA